jgi:hypothetical protein
LKRNFGFVVSSPRGIIFTTFIKKFEKWGQ